MRSYTARGFYKKRGQPWTVKRLLARTEKDNNGCLNWIGSSRNKAGYAGLCIDKTGVLVSRFIMELIHGEKRIKDVNVLHECDNPKCINPRHLYLGTQAQNAADMVARGRHARMTGQRGERCVFAKLRATDIPGIRELLSNGAHPKVIAKSYGVSRMAISLIRDNKTWASIK